MLPAKLAGLIFFCCSYINISCLFLFFSNLNFSSIILSYFASQKGLIVMPFPDLFVLTQTLALNACAAVHVLFGIDCVIVHLCGMTYELGEQTFVLNAGTSSAQFLDVYRTKLQ